MARCVKQGYSSNSGIDKKYNVKIEGGGNNKKEENKTSFLKHVEFCSHTVNISEQNWVAVKKQATESIGGPAVKDETSDILVKMGIDFKCPCGWLQWFKQCHKIGRLTNAVVSIL